MKRWDVMAGVSGSIAVLAFVFLVVAMVYPHLADFSATAFAALAAGALGTIVGIVGMSQETMARSTASDDAVFPMGRLDVYRQLQRNRDREQDEWS